MEKITPSSYQQAIYDFIQNEEGNLIVKADAGSGKTYTIKTALKYIPPTKSTIFVAFNKAIAVELQKEIPNYVQAMTLHSLSLKAINGSFGKTKVDKKKLFKVIISLINEDEKVYISPILKMVGLLKNNLLEPTIKNIDILAYHHSLELPINISRYTQLVEKAYHKSIDSEESIDFDDMICFPYLFNLTFTKKYDFIFVDEAQDLNNAQVDLILRAIKPNGRIIAVGDTAQCQPEGTQVYKTGEGYIPIENISIGDEMLTYFNGYFTGTKTQGRKVVDISKRKYHGKLIKITAGNKSHYCTPEHRCVVQMKKKNGWAVYIMKKGNHARVGTTKSLNNPASSVALRARQEHADAAWIIDIFSNKEDALLTENKIAYMYGIPQLVFQRKWEVKENTIHTQDWNNKFWEDFPNNICFLESCLRHYKRDKRFPFWKKQKNGGEVGKKKGSLYTFITQASNLIDGWMNVCTFNGELHGKRKNWKTVSISYKNYYGFVYSLKLEDRWRGHPTYISQGIVTHNSIYGFRGADTESIPKLTKLLKATTLPLSISYRCPKSHIRLAQQYVPTIEAAPGAKEGKIISLNEEDLYKYIKPGDLALCRNNAPLIKPCLSLLKRGIKSTIKGRDIGKNLATLVKNFRARTIPELKHSINKWENNEIERATKKNQNPQLIEDKADCLYSFISNSGAKTPAQLIEYIKAIFSDDKAEIVFSSIHKAKGLESKNVFFLQPSLIPSKYAEQEWELIQEQNLYYVAITRAKENLYMVS